MKKLIMVLAMALMAIGVKAETKLIIHQKDGAEVDVLLKEKPVGTYEGAEFVVTSEDAVLRFPLSELAKITFEEDATRVESVTVQSKGSGMSRIYDISGKLVKTLPEGETVDLTDLQRGIYIVKNNNHSYKIEK